jgi:hypothetical protein
MTRASQHQTMELNSAKPTMAAIVQNRYSTAPEDVLRLQQVAIPAIRDDEVLLRVRPRAWTGGCGISWPGCRTS